MDNLQNIDIISWLFPILATDELLFRYANKANTYCLCYFTAKSVSLSETELIVASSVTETTK